jgi:serine/threonine protein kinase
MFDVVGCQSFLAPEFFSEDGYSFEIDIWAAGVLLFFMLTNDYPFKFKNKSPQAFQEEFAPIIDGFSFEKKL